MNKGLSLNNFGKFDLYKLAWSIFSSIPLLLSFLITPILLCFPHDLHWGWAFFDLGLTIIFLGDDFFYKKYTNKALFSKKRNRNKWLLSSLFLRNFPFVSLFISLGINSSYIAVFFLFRFLKAKYNYKRINRIVEQMILPSAMKTLSILAFCMGIIHWLACAWVIIHPPEGIDNLTIYNKSLYWAITTLTTIGYGDITPTTNGSRVFTMVIMLLGVGLYGVLIAQISRLMISSDKRKESNKEKLENLTSFLKHYNVPYNLQQQVFGFYRHLLTKKLNDGEVKILSELPGPLQTELKTYMMMQPISNVILFKGCSFHCIKDVSQNLEEIYVPPGRDIITKGDDAAEMFIIIHGDVEVIRDGVHVASLHSGQCFGEMSLILGGTRSANIKASNHCDLYKLDKEKFEEILNKHKDLKSNVEKLINERLSSAS